MLRFYMYNTPDIGPSDMFNYLSSQVGMKYEFNLNTKITMN